jgi:adenylate kinase family enzyme|tara:strand:+ start:1104 stop:1901 length:798 start_codon:yes stop_codon:yes gene_type:complete
MISLYNLIKEQIEKPKAIILAGAPGAGKGYVLSGLNLDGIKVLNVDNSYIELLKKANVSLDLKNAGPEDRSKAAIAMAAANKEFKGKVAATIEGKESFILDGTAASIKQTANLKKELEETGYEVFMLYVYTDLERSLKQNQGRFEKTDGEDRSLAPGIVLRSWSQVTDNFKAYKAMFDSNFVSVANTLQDEKINNLPGIIKKYLDPFKPQGTKPKDAKAQARSDKSKEALNSKLLTLLSDEAVEDIINTSVSKEEAQSKIKAFLS